LDVNYQKGEEPTAERPEGGYVEVKKVYDVNGNEPGKAPAQAQPQGQVQPAQTSPYSSSREAGGEWCPTAAERTDGLASPAQAWSPGGQGVAANPPGDHANYGIRLT